MTIDFQNNPYATFFLTFLVFWTIFFVFNVVLFFKLRSSFFIRSRSPWLIFMSAIGQYLMTLTLTFKIIIGPKNYMNFFDHWFIWFMLPLHFLPYPVRSLRFILIYYMNNYEFNDEKKTNKKMMKFSSWLNKHNKYITDKAFFILFWIIMALAFAVGLYRNIAIKDNHWGRKFTANSNTYWVSCLTFLAIVSILLWIAVYFLRQIQDELKYNFELTAIGICWIFFIGIYIAVGFTGKGPDELPSIILLFLCVISMLLSFGMPIQLASVKPTDVNFGFEDINKFETVMEDKEGLKAFRDFLIKNSCLEPYLFYREVNKYQDLETQEEMNAEFDYIKKQFIVPGAPYVINISSLQVKEILNVKGNPSSNVFNNAMKANLQLLKTDIFPKFKSSQFAKDYLKKLKARKNLIIGETNGTNNK